VTIEKLAEVLDTKPYRIVEVLIRRSLFPAPGDTIADRLAQDVAALSGVDLVVIDDDDGSDPAPVPLPLTPIMPSDLANAL